MTGRNPADGASWFLFLYFLLLLIDFSTCLEFACLFEDSRSHSHHATHLPAPEWTSGRRARSRSRAGARAGSEAVYAPLLNSCPWGKSCESSLGRLSPAASTAAGGEILASGAPDSLATVTQPAGGTASSHNPFGTFSPRG